MQWSPHTHSSCARGMVPCPSLCANGCSLTSCYRRNVEVVHERAGFSAINSANISKKHKRRDNEKKYIANSISTLDKLILIESIPFKSVSVVWMVVIRCRLRLEYTFETTSKPVIVQGRDADVIFDNPGVLHEDHWPLGSEVLQVSRLSHVPTCTRSIRVWG